MSLVDLFPTFVDLAGGAETDFEPVEGLDGASLVPLADTGSDVSRDDVVFGENLAEGATAPILMVKRGAMKYVVSGCDPEQLFDLATDPDELTNLADDPGYADVRRDMAEIAARRWDMADLADRVRSSQRRRSFLRRVADETGSPDWDHGPPDQAAQHVMTADTDYHDWAYGRTLGPR